MSDTNKRKMENIISFAKRRGFIFPGSSLYGGLAGTWDYGPLGFRLKENIKKAWFSFFIDRHENMFALDTPILLHPKVWEASGHVKEFTDPLVDCKNCRGRFRADHIKGNTCPACGKTKLTKARPFNMLFKTWIGPLEEASSRVYLRPENAQGILINFKNVIDTVHPSLPFGIAQIGKVFRNEISPGEFLFRTREFELAEFEYFMRPKQLDNAFDYWKNEMLKWADILGLSRKKMHEHDLPDGERAHYSSRTVDFEYDYPFGKKELMAIACRGDYDLSAHAKGSGEKLEYFDEEARERFIPHVVEPTFGLDRAFLAVLCESYKEEDLPKDEKRAVLSLPFALAPFQVAVFPLVSNKENIVKKARSVYESVRESFVSVWDDIGNIGKR
ncbi:MAG: glycine--tRNA ligase, partial [Candidatus Niyogibacteria bacterium]|nr:glycine--tRNA ligase [Candidatus Niyogibacteria bacterium]